METQLSAELALWGRNRLIAKKVENVESFDEKRVVLNTSLGDLEIRGEHMNVVALDLEHKEVILEGKMDGACYLEKKGSKAKKKTKNILSRLVH